MREVAAGRPHPDVASLQATAEVALTDADLDEAMAGHPRIGDRTAGGASRREQNGVAGADPAVLAALADGNRAYEERFGHVYLVCASGRGAQELLDVLRARLGNDPATERAVALAELAAINRLRIAAVEEEVRASSRANHRHASRHASEGDELSTHVLDAARGTSGRRRRRPARRRRTGRCSPTATTDADGRVRRARPTLAAGDYRLAFATGDYFAATGQQGFYPEVVVAFTVTDAGAAPPRAAAAVAPTPTRPTAGADRWRSSSAPTSTGRRRTASSGSTARPRGTRSATSPCPPRCAATSRPRTCTATRRAVLPTDTQKNTAYAFAKEHGLRRDRGVRARPWPGTSSTTSSR